MWLRVLALWILCLSMACKTDQTLVRIGGQPVDAAKVDASPLEVLPSGALFVGTLDAATLFSSNLGGPTAGIVNNLLPLGPESNFQAHRDVHRIYGAVYAMQGADFVAVLQGNFDVPAIQRAAQTRAATPSGLPLIVTRYGDHDMYTIANVGFVPLTAHTIVSGNETGMRRALDRLRYGQLKNDLPPWMVELLHQTSGIAPAAPPGQPPTAGERPAFVMVGDVGGGSVLQGGAQQIPFLDGMTLVRVLGNFKPPGMNVVGSLSYSDDAKASAGAQNLAQVQQLAYLASLFATWGFGGRMPDLNVQQQGKDVAFATQFDTSMLNLMLRMIGETLSARPGTTPFWGRP